MITKITIGICGNQYSSGGSQPLIDIDCPFSLHAGYPFDSNVTSSSYVEIKHMGDYISYVFNLRPSLVHSVGAIRDGVLWIALTIPTGMNVCDSDGNYISPLDILEKVFSIFSEHYMHKRGNGSYEFKEGTCFRAPVDAYIDSLTLVRNPYISYIPMNNGSTCYLSMDREKMGLFLKDTQYPEFAQYKSVIIAESVLSQTPFNSPVPRPLYVDVRYGNKLLGQINYYGRQNFECVVEPSNTDTHESVSVRFSLDDLKNSSEEYRGNNFTARRQSSYISVEPVFPEKKRFIKINSDDSMWKGSYIENGSDKIYAQVSGTSYGFFLSTDQLREEWKLHLAPSSEFSDVVWQLGIQGDLATPRCPKLMSDRIIAVDVGIKEKIIEAYKPRIAPIGNTSNSNAPMIPGNPDNEADVILGVDDIKTLCKEDHDAKLLLFFDKGSGYSKNSILVENKRVFEFLASQNWRLKAPYNPHLSGYRLEIKSNKYNYKTQKPNEELPLHNIVEATPKESLYKKAQDFFFPSKKEGQSAVSPDGGEQTSGVAQNNQKGGNNNFLVKFIILFFAVLAIVVVPCCIYNEAVSKKIKSIPGLFAKYLETILLDSEAPGTSIDSTKIKIGYIKQCVSDLKYNGQELSFDTLLDMLSKRTPEDSPIDEIIAKEASMCLVGICNEIKQIQSGTYQTFSLLQYQKPSGVSSNNVLRKNISFLIHKENSIYDNLDKAIESLYKINGKKVPNERYDEFQKKYVIENYRELKEITTFSELHALYEKFKQADE